ncbi:hydroxysteroid 11-beta-dehydrogenase 1-like protein A [Bombina bombina]|uniref:hydroxysteroid 11-beta-dehydrogenase 1-like protein A n=1 Tax=Bombina bombina TaxID=8345 RepID=UPI00235A701A|nr:hydroxysteroid 11-beta-dehydrogenase 1-like protein A [Bombina bombina]
MAGAKLLLLSVCVGLVAYYYFTTDTFTPEKHPQDSMAGVKLLLLSLSVGLAAYYFFRTETLKPELVRGKRVLVTGASTGIGEQLAYQFAKLGARVIITARREERLKEVVKKCLELGASSAHYVVSDMGNLSSAQNVGEETLKELGGLDYLVLNHVGGNSAFGNFNRDMDTVRNSLTINFLSYVQVTSATLSALQKSQGSIIIMSSMSGRIGAPFTATYCASKFALEGFYSSLRREFSLRDQNVSVTVAVLGYIDTESALRKVGDKVTMVASPKEECAFEVVKAGVLRQPELFYPYWGIRLFVLLRDWAPGLVGKILDKFYVLENITQ